MNNREFREGLLAHQEREKPQGSTDDGKGIELQGETQHAYQTTPLNSRRRFSFGNSSEQKQDSVAEDDGYLLPERLAYTIGGTAITTFLALNFVVLLSLPYLRICVAVPACTSI